MTNRENPVVVVVEDEGILLKALNIELLNAGYTVVSASEGESALKLIKKHKPDLVLLDLIMPGVDGFEVLADLKSDKQVKEIPVIILTNLAQEEDKKKVMKLGAADYFVKSNADLEKITEKISKILNK